MKKLFLFSLIALESLMAQAQVALHGLYTPIHLNGDTTTIYLRDYLADQTLDSYLLPTGLTNHSQQKDTLILTGKLTEKMEFLWLKTPKGMESLVLINPALQDVTISVPAGGEFNGEVKVIGAFNNWNRGSAPLVAKGGQYRRTYRLNPGKYEYKFYVNGKELLDPNNPVKVSNGMGDFNNVLEVKYPQKEEPAIYHALSFDEGSIKLSPLPADQKILALWNNQPLPLASAQSNTSQNLVPIPQKAAEVKRSYLRVYSFRGEKAANDVLIPLEYGVPITNVDQLERLDWHQARMYFLMVDRFFNGNPENDQRTPDPEIHPKANYYGGDLSGVTQKTEEGFFEDLHVNTIWLSPITQNPEDAWGYWDKGKTKSKFSAYHGYWPVSNIRVDHRFGTSAELRTLLNDAHQRNENVILDYVANHIHINHPIYQKHQDWATSLYLPDGTKNTEKWDEYRLTTWFDDHLPTLDLRRWEIVDPMADSALFWVTEYDLTASVMMPLNTLMNCTGVPSPIACVNTRIARYCKSGRPTAARNSSTATSAPV